MAKKKDKKNKKKNNQPVSGKPDTSAQTPDPAEVGINTSNEGDMNIALQMIEITNPDEILKMYQRGLHERLLIKLIKIFEFFTEHTFLLMEGRLQYHLDRFVQTFLFIMTREDFVIADRFITDFIGNQNIIASIIGMSSFRNTDPQIKMLLHQKKNFFKLLTLYSTRNRVHLDNKIFFDTNSKAASIWYFMFFNTLCGCPTPEIYQNALDMLDSVNEKLILPSQCALGSYFTTTYVDNTRDWKLKSKINSLVKEQVKGAKIRNNPDGKTIAIVTSKWFPSSSVHRCYGPGVEELSKKYDLVLVHLGEKSPYINTSYMKEVRHVWVDGLKTFIGEIDNNNFQMAFFPDIGMSFESLYLANMRLAPIQVMAYGHPVSTYGAEIDYFIGGKDIEFVEDAKKNYSERLVLIPGIGQPTIRPPHFDLDNLDRSRKEEQADRIIINCSWGQDKVMFPLVQCMREIKARSKKQILFRMFPNQGLHRCNFFVPWKLDLEEMLGVNSVEVCSVRGPDYIRAMAIGDFSIDSHPFNGYNTVVDSLLVGAPIVTLEGRKCYERVAAALLRRVGLDEFITSTHEEYIQKTLRFIEDDEYRNAMREKVTNADLMGKVFVKNDANHFATAIDYLMENHEQLKQENSKQPIDLCGLCQ